MPETKPNDSAWPSEYGIGGMTKREYIASLAMQILIGKVADKNQPGLWSALAEDSVTIADELIKELNK